MREMAKKNAIRSGIVVVGSLAFGYLTLQLGVKPFVQKAQYALDKSEASHDRPDHFGDAQVVSQCPPDGDS